MGVYKMLKSSSVTRDSRFPGIALLLVINVSSIGFLMHWCRTSNSMVLLAYTCLSYFHLLSLLTSILGLWVCSRRPELAMSYGFERCETLAVFSSTVLVQLAALFVAVSCAERLFFPPDVATGRLLVGAAVGLLCHLLPLVSGPSRTLQHVIEVSPSSWLQEQFADVCHSVCGVVPGLGRLLLPRVHTLALLSVSGAALVSLTAAAIDARHYHVVDPIAGLCLAACLVGTMYPLCVNVGRSLLQTTPSHVVSQLDKCLREALTLDGVLEFRHEHFWTLSTGVLAGSLHVRVRRDANEQDVLSQVSARFASLVHVLTVQVFKDDWTRSHTTLHLLTSSALDQPTYAPPRYASPRLSFSPTEPVPRPGATVASAPQPPPLPLANGGGVNRLYLSALDPPVAPPSDGISYYVSKDGGPLRKAAAPVAPPGDDMSYYGRGDVGPRRAEVSPVAPPIAEVPMRTGLR